MIRRAFLLALVLASCAQLPDQVIGGYEWVADPKSPHCEQVTWKQVSADRIPGLCMGLDGRAATENTSCAIGCLVISRWSAAQAMQIRLGWDDTLYQHESRHVLLGLVHPQ